MHESVPLKDRLKRSRAGRRAIRELRRQQRLMQRRWQRMRSGARRVLVRGLSTGVPRESIERRFSRIYRLNLWRGSDSRSGPGSTLDETRVVRTALPNVVREYGVRKLLDIPCGDFSWMSGVPLDLESYIGADVVTRLVSENTKRYGAPDRTFVRLDIRSDRLPTVDLVFCRDCLEHLSLTEAEEALDNIARSGSTYLLATTYPTRDANPDIRTGDWRPLNLERPPFSLHAPITLINEESRKPGYADKSIGLWAIAGIAHHDA